MNFLCILVKAASVLILFNFSLYSNKHSEQNLVTYSEVAVERWPSG
jgi:hypothetical protein